MARGRNTRRRAEQLGFAELLLAGSDPFDLERWRELMTEDVHLRVANRTPAVGLARSIEELTTLFARAQAMGRGFRELWPSADGRTTLMELDLSPIEGSAIPLGVVVRLAQPMRLASDIRFYLDPTPLKL